MIDHESYEELISATLTGDLSEAEQRRLEMHLEGCARCRSTLTAFTEGRRLVAGMRHVPPPRDLSARVRTGIERGRLANVPWWRHPAAIFTGVAGAAAIVAGVLLGLAVLRAPGPEVAASLSPSPTASTSIPPSSTPIASPSAAASPAETPEPTPGLAVAEPVLMITGARREESAAVAIVNVESGEELPAQTEDGQEPVTGEPLTGALSDGDDSWLAFTAREGLSGNVHYWAVNVTTGQTIPLGTGIQTGNPFDDTLAWSPDGRILAFTLQAADAEGPDVFLFDSVTMETGQLTDSARSFAASWDVPDAADEAEAPMSLWVSEADTADPTSHRIELDPDALPSPAQPADLAVESLAGVFLPQVGASGRVIYWSGEMILTGDGWTFGRNGMPYVAESLDALRSGETPQQLFPTLSVPQTGEAFSSAAIRWGPDGDTFAVWKAMWTSTGQPEGFPDATDVYFGQVTSDRLITQLQAIDEGDIPEGYQIIDVAVAPTGEHLAITVQAPPGEAGPPEAELLLITRKLGNEADVVESLSQNGGWSGPAVYGPKLEQP